MDGITVVNNIEINIYILLGIRYFQKMVFLLEKFIHRKDGKRNQNYHFKTATVYSMDQFIKYLFFNGAIHFRNICLFMLYFLVKGIILGYHFYDIAFLLLMIKDLYCIMLQRYNFIRIKEAKAKARKIKEKKINLEVEKLLPVFRSVYLDCNVNEELKLIYKIKASLDNKTVLVLDEKDEILLKHLFNVINNREGEESNG